MFIVVTEGNARESWKSFKGLILRLQVPEDIIVLLLHFNAKIKSQHFLGVDHEITFLLYQLSQLLDSFA